jgi:hypothetical protein
MKDGIIYRTKSDKKDIFVIKIKEIKVLVIQDRKEPLELVLNNDTNIHYITKTSDKNFELKGTTID